MIEGALSFVDKHGLEELTLRALAPTIGVSHTAIYTYFKTKTDMINALATEVLAKVLSIDLGESTTAKDQLISMAVSIRTGLLAHPNLVPAFLTAAGMSDVTGVITANVIGLLESAGLDPHDALVTYQALEAYVFGSVIYEVGTDLNFLEVRRLRYRSIQHPEALKAARSNKAMKQLNDEVFVTGFERLLVASGL